MGIGGKYGTFTFALSIVQGLCDFASKISKNPVGQKQKWDFKLFFNICPSPQGMASLVLSDKNKIVLAIP